MTVDKGALIQLLPNFSPLTVPQTPMFSLLVLLLASLCAVTAEGLSLSSAGLTVVLNDISYYVSPYAVGNVIVNSSALAGSASVNGFYPITVLADSVSSSELGSLVQNFTAADDVFQEAFLQVIYTPDVVTLGSYEVCELDTSIPTGPYFLEASTGAVYMTYRLYSDFAGAFSQPLLQTPSGGFDFLSAQIAGSASLTIGVPSKLYYTPTVEMPLAGVRIGIKNIYDLEGVKTADGNRAYYNLYPPRNANAVAVQKLIDAGAIIVGHQKASQFANGEEATADWVDYHSPFNPRGDGYQDPSSSSSGAGASIGSYPWLDIALGSDTGGSIRGPSEVQGLFGNRPSHGLVSLTGVMPLAPELDTAGFLTRDPVLWKTAQEVLYSNLSSFTSYPKTIYTYEYPTNASSTDDGENSDMVLVDFINSLASFLSANVSDLNLTAAWEATGPTNTTSDVNELLNITYPILISKEQINLVRTPFYADYAAVHDGRLPFVDPAPLVRWAFGDSYPASTLTEAIYNKTLFMNWFQSHVTVPDPVTCSDSLLIYVGSTAEPNERNQYSGPPQVPYGFSAGRISVFSEVPDSVFPIGEANYFANTTMHQEALPVTVDILAAKGCDVMIAQLAQDLVKAGILSMPQTGGTIYGGDILMKRDAEMNGMPTRYVG